MWGVRICCSAPLLVDDSATRRGIFGASVQRTQRLKVGMPACLARQTSDAAAGGLCLADPWHSPAPSRRRRVEVASFPWPSASVGIAAPSAIHCASDADEEEKEAVEVDHSHLSLEDLKDQHLVDFAHRHLATAYDYSQWEKPLRPKREWGALWPTHTCMQHT